MRRFSFATVLGGLLLLGTGGSLRASDTPKAPRPAARRKAVASKTAGKVDVKLDNLYVDSEIGQVFTVNLGRADQAGSASETLASMGSVQVYQLGGSESEPPASTGAAGQADPPADADNSADAMEPADDDEATPPDEMQAAPQASNADDPEEAMDPAADDSAEDPAAAPQAAPAQPEPGTAKPPAAKEAPKTPPPAGSSQTPPPPPPPIR